MLLLENSYHMITIDKERRLLIDRLARFFSGISRAQETASAPPSLLQA
jgi:carboxylesterase